MKNTFLISAAFLVAVGNCSSCTERVDKTEAEPKSTAKTVEEKHKEVHNHQIDSIAEMIDAFEYLKRENYGTWISEERIEHLKDSINYDSIVLHRALKNQIK
jgi:hypothetical protein